MKILAFLVSFLGECFRNGCQRDNASPVILHRHLCRCEVHGPRHHYLTRQMTQDTCTDDDGADECSTEDDGDDKHD